MIKQSPLFHAGLFRLSGKPRALRHYYGTLRGLAKCGLSEENWEVWGSYHARVINLHISSKSNGFKVGRSTAISHYLRLS